MLVKLDISCVIVLKCDVMCLRCVYSRSRGRAAAVQHCEAGGRARDAVLRARQQGRGQSVRQDVTSLVVTNVIAKKYRYSAFYENDPFGQIKLKLFDVQIE